MISTKLLSGAAGMLCMVAVLTLSVGFGGAAQASDTPSLAPMNPSFLEYLQNGHSVLSEQPAGGSLAGLIPEPFVLPKAQRSSGGTTVMSTGTVTALPSTFDLRTQNKLTPIRNQGSCGSCWSFASYGSLESSLKPNEAWDFSENNLKNRHGFDLSCCSGGNRAMATSYLARWDGPLAEADDPYNAGSCLSPTGLLPKRHVQDVVFIPARGGYLDNNALKQAVMDYGAVYTSYYHSDAYYNSSTASYYYNAGTRANHGVCIVGWDDNYDRSKFRTPPPGNGAFIIRNSWGTWWGQNGYFYMSYYDTSLAGENAAFIGESNTNFDTIYQYDPYGWITSAGYGSNTAWFANVFTATANGSVMAASWYTPVANCSYELRVYTNPTSGPVSTSGPVATKIGTMATAGYHTARLDSGVPVTAGQKFSVVVKLTTPGYGSPVPLERPYSGYCSRATAQTGQSYMSSSGTSWTDVAARYGNTNVCLKAFASRSSVPGPGMLSVTPLSVVSASGPVGGPFSPASQTYTLSNTGGTVLEWSAGTSQLWTSLSSSSGTLAPGATATVTVSIDADANTLSAGQYSGTVTFQNTTTGSGNTSRSITLSVAGAGTLTVTPSTGLSSTGSVGGPFSPSSQTYTLSNTGGASINWTASKTQTWVTLSTAGGTLSAGASTTVTVSLNAGINSLPAGTYTDTVAFTNATSGSGNTARPVSLTVSAVPPPTLTVTPANGLASTGPMGGPFSPASQAYTLRNSGTTYISWSATRTQSWVTVSPANGSLAPGASATVNVSLSSWATSLIAGTYSDTVSFRNTTTGVGNTTRTVSLTVSSGSTAGNYRVVGTTYNWIDPTGHTRIPVGNDTVSLAQAIPFSFKFYGRYYSALHVGSNGMVGFGTAGMYSMVNTPLPYYYAPNAAIYAYWDNLNPAAGGTVTRGVLGAAPNRQMVISWVGVPIYASSTSKVSFQVILTEGSEDIIVQYQNVAPTDYVNGAGRAATIGVENETGRIACQYSYNTASLTDGKALRFTNQ